MTQWRRPPFEVAHAAMSDDVMYHVGDYVKVKARRRYGAPDSQGGPGWVTGHDETTGFPNVRYALDNHNSPAVKPRRLRCIKIDTDARPRQGDKETLPSLTSALRPRVVSPVPDETVAELTVSQNNNPWTTLKLLNVAGQRAANGKNKALEHMETKMLRGRNHTGKGWLRRIEAEANSGGNAANVTMQLSADEKRLVQTLYFSLRLLASDRTVSLIAYAWGVTAGTIRCWSRKWLSDPTLSTQRKKRNDAGETIFNSDQKQKQVYTVLSVFAKRLRRSRQGEKVDAADISEAWSQAPAAVKQSAAAMADNLMQRGPHLVGEVQQVLKQTNGSVTWRQLAAQLGTADGDGTILPASHQALMQFTMSLPDSKYKLTRTHPSLDRSNIIRRFEWSKAFWVFWETSKLVAAAVQIGLVHMDEKWFYAIVLRRHNKRVPFLQIEPIQHSVKHKSHIYKVLGIASTMFLPHDNDVTQGGAAGKVNLVRAGKMMPAKKDTYRRVYNADGTFHYPKIEVNRLRRKGELYFEPVEITGSTEGTAANPKYSLLKYFEKVEIPRLESICQKVLTRSGKRLVVRYQMDGAGPHTDRALQDFLAVEFDRCGWIFRLQPSNSPLTNVKDASIFPAISKKVTAEQGLSKGSAVVEGEELWNIVKKCWKKFPADTIARAYVHHHQIVNAIYADHGGDSFVRQTDGLHCGLRKCYKPYFVDGRTVPSGVRVLDNVTPDMLEQTLKYAKPDVASLKLGDCLNKQELQFVFDHCNAASDVWEQAAAAIGVMLEGDIDLDGE